MTHPYDSSGESDPASQSPEQGGSGGYPGYGSGSQGGYPGGQPPQPGGGQPDYGQAGGHSGYPGYQGGYGYGGPPQDLPKGLAIAALVLGILALVTFWSAIGGIVLGIIAVVLGAVAIRKSGRGEAGGRGMAIGGLVVGILGLLGGIIVAIVLVAGLAMFGGAIQECQQFQGDPQRYQQCFLENAQGAPQSFGISANHVTIQG